MKHFYRALILIAILVSYAHSTSYIKLLVNEVESDSMTQGDVFTWEYDLSLTGGEGILYIYVDVDGDRVISDQDVLLDGLEMKDGETGRDGPGDSSSEPDGIIRTEFGPFGFAPENYIFHVIDQNDYSEALGSLLIKEMNNPGVRITGTLSKEDVPAPDSRLENIMVGSQNFDSYMGYWSGLTNVNGQYTINLPDSAAGNEWWVGLFFENNQLIGYLDTEEYEETLLAGTNSGFDFYLSLPQAYVYGSIIDLITEQLVAVNDYGRLRNLNNEDDNDFEILNGNYLAAASFREGETSDQFQLELSGENLIPDYLIPKLWNDSSYTFPVNKGDSLEKNIYVYSTNASIYVQITMDGASAEQTFFVVAENHNFGETRGYSNEDGFLELKVRDSSDYYVWLNTYPDWGRPLPDGYIVEGSSNKNAQPGDTVKFNLINAPGMLTGKLNIDENDKSHFNLRSAGVMISGDSTSEVYANIDSSWQYKQGVKNDQYYIQFQHWQGDFLARPSWYENISVNNDTIDTLNFDLNYCHAALDIQVTGAPQQVMWEWWNINTDDPFPNFYQVAESADIDTIFHYRVCDGNWIIKPPYFGDEYIVYPKDTTLVVDNDTDYFELSFEYKLKTSIEAETQIPTEFFVKQNYPNPFNPITTIEFALPEKSKINVSVYDIRGRLVDTILNEEKNIGVHKIQWNATGHASGMYIFKVTTKSKTVSKKLLLLK